jgi:signal peptidase II
MVKTPTIDIRSQCWLFIFVMVDLFSKHWAIEHLLSHSVDILPGWLSLQLAFNHGTAFSMLSQSGAYWHMALTGLNALTILGLAWWLFKYPKHSQFRQWSLVLLIAGGCGNFFNRWLHQYVVDFIALSIHGHNLFICNIADIYITFGLMMLIYDQYMINE